jgi:hypothetical protein
LFDGDPHRFRVARAVAIGGIEPQHAQVGRQAAQMEDSPLMRTSSTSVCGTPKLSIISATEAGTKNSFSMV